MVAHDWGVGGGGGGGGEINLSKQVKKERKKGHHFLMEELTSLWGVAGALTFKMHDKTHLT